MFKRFLDGIVFGLGLGISFVVVCIASFVFVLPKVIESAQKEPNFVNPKIADVVDKTRTQDDNQKSKYSVFKDVDLRMEIPEGGGILSISPLNSDHGSERPSTYQLWLTHTEFWQIETDGEGVKIEEIAYPSEASISSVDALMEANVGLMSGRSSLTISKMEIDNLRAGRNSMRDDSLNGKLNISTENVVFLLPDSN